MSGQLDLSGKTIAVTGGSRGIGLAIAERLLEHGANVAICARGQDELMAATKTLRDRFPPGGRIVAESCDVTDESSLDRFFTAAGAINGSLHGLVTTAGIYGAIGPFEKLSFDEWRKGVEVNLFGCALSVHRALPFVKSGGRIALFSGGGQGPMANFSAYVTSKGAIWRFTETLAAELAPRGVMLNAIAPGAINTKFLDELLAAGPDKVGPDFYRKSVEQKQSGGESPYKAADLVAWLMSEQSSGLYGKTISAIWDPYTTWKNLPELSKSDAFAYRRIVPKEGNQP